MTFEFSRRNALKTLSCGFGYMALAGLTTKAAEDSQNPLAPKAPHYPATAKRVIFLCMRGGPSHVDTFDYKPQLAKDSGKQAPNQKNRKLMGSPWSFQQHGESGLPISDLFPHLGKHADDLCLINGMAGEVPNHPQAYLKLHTGSFRFVRPSVGAWALYGLGTENQDLPGFITLNPETRVGGAQNYGSSFLPAYYQGTAIGQINQSLANARFGNIKNSRFSESLQRQQLDLLQEMNQELLNKKEVSPELEGVIESYELAFRMQNTVPTLMDVSSESKETLEMYGVGVKETDNFGRQCLLARRFAESGVRFIELCHGNWDQHGNLKGKLESNCRATDKPIAALLSDLKQRGMLKDTLVVWGGEFGRTPHVKQQNGRDHNATGFSTWIAGGGAKGGQRVGATDEYGITAVENKMDFHDLHATMLHMLGLDHTKLTYRYAGRDFRLTDVYGRVVKEVLS
ncbi:DUF1501 domain-containing protein [bacterium]|nr:DUF1501 domain-containing protein [bacterium]MDA7904655.1 DUF1501 domain-containing protein [bacterium]MDA7906549.1 DUF1501 domain-containing protein [Mariniblastus sp.]MDB4372870.1 DUF1501 domain-containing protein [Mariniblastus sp.]MDC3223568.1 DUF1501 domain-containing protein [Mariniblastus sp.]